MSETTTATNLGTIVQVIGPVVDVDFSSTGILPKLYEALVINFDVNGTATKLTLESSSTSATSGSAPSP
jgi:F-type H+-transporting ATPase subunit beta